jgi:hypothetical protein
MYKLQYKYTHLQYERKHKYLIQILVSGATVSSIYTVSSSTLNLIYKLTNKMQLCRIIYCSSTALHVSRDIFAHHQELLNCIYSFWYYSRTSLPADVMTPTGKDICE